MRNLIKMADIGRFSKCGECKNRVSDAQKAVQCDGRCNHWFHIVCARVSEDTYRELSRNKSKKWFCQSCVLGHIGCGEKEDNAAFHSLHSAELMRDNSHQPPSNPLCMKEQYNFSTDTWSENQRAINETSKAFQKKESLTNEEISGPKSNPGEVVWKCPLCCHKCFRTHISLKNHIEKLLDTVRCPGCLKNVGSIRDLVKHLDSECTAINATNETTHFESPAEECDTNVRQLEEESSQFCPGSCDVTDTQDERWEKYPEREAVERPRTYFSCSACCITFSSVEEHVKLYHAKQDVLVKRLGSREVYRPEPAKKRLKVADKGVSKVIPSKSACKNSGQKKCDENNVPHSFVKTGSKNNYDLTMGNDTMTVSFADNSNILTEKFWEQYNVRGNLGNGLGRKKRKIPRVVLTRIPDEKLNKFLKLSCKEVEQRKESDRNYVSSICDARKESNTVSEQLKHKILLNILTQEFDDPREKHVETDKVCNSSNTQITTKKVVMPERLGNTINRQHGESRPLSNVTKESNIVVNSDSVVHRFDASLSNEQCCTAKKNKVSSPGSTSVAQQSVELSGLEVMRSKDLSSATGRESSAFQTPLSTTTVKSIQSFGSYPELFAAVDASEAEGTRGSLASAETLHRRTQCVVCNSSGIPVSGVWCSASLVLNNSSVQTCVVSRNGVVSGEVTNKRTRTTGGVSYGPAMCDCVRNKDEDFAVRKVIDESGKLEQNLCVCLKCHMGFAMYELYYKHVCDKDNFLCTCVNNRLKGTRKTNVANEVVISEPDVFGSTEAANSLGEGTCAEVVSWRKLLEVTTSKTLVCSVCSNMFMSEGSSFSDKRAVAVRLDSFPQNDNGTIANYTCKICSIVTEKRRGRVLVSKVNDTSLEAVEIIVVDPNENCDLGT